MSKVQIYGRTQNNEKTPYDNLIKYYRKQLLCRVSEALDKAWKTLSKSFVECDTRQRRLGELYIVNGFFAEYFLSGSRQRLCRVSLGTWQRKIIVTAPGDGDGACAECPLSDTRQMLPLCRVSAVLTLDKEAPRGPLLPVPLSSVLGGTR
jgi:hypothetical protein